MSDLDVVIEANRTAVANLIAAAEASAAVWTTARAPGKWSPCQVVEHVALTIEEGAKVVAGGPSVFPTFPAFLRPVIRGVFFNRVLKKDRFPKARTLKGLDPLNGPATTAETRERLERALTTFIDACRKREAGGHMVEHGVFGTVSVTDYAKFMELHTIHHREQMPG